MRAADAINLVNARKLRRRQHERDELSLRCRHRHHQPRNAGDLGRDRIHQHRGGIGGASAGHVQADRFDGAPTRPQLDAEGIGETVVGRELTAVIGLDAIACERERIKRPAFASRIGAA